MYKKFDIEEIPGIPDNPNNKYNFRALIIITVSDEHKEERKKSPAFDFLESLNKRDFRKIMVSMKIVARQGNSTPRNHFKKDNKGREVFEIRTPTGNDRLLCFPDKNDTLLICCNSATKTKGVSVQSREFNKCFEIKKAYYKYKYGENIIK